MNTWWEKQEGLKKLAEIFEASQNDTTLSEDMRYAPKPPMSPFGDNIKKDKNGKEIK